MSASSTLSKALKNSLGRAARDVNKAVLSGSKKALNRASKFAYQELVKDLTDDTGLPTKDVKSRIKLFATSKQRAKTSIHIATKRGTALDKFKAKTQKVKVAPRVQRAKGARGRPKTKAYYGMSVKIGKQPRQLVPGAFLQAVGKSGKVIGLGRKRAFTDGVYTRANTERYPTIRPLTTVLQDSAKDRAKGVRDRMQKVFDANISDDIAAAIAKAKAE